MKKYFIIWIAILLSMPAAFAQENCYEKSRNRGIAAYNAGNYEKAIEYFKIAKSCDLPVNNDLRTWISKCNVAIRAAEDARQRRMEEQERAAGEQEQREQAKRERERARAAREEQEREQAERDAREKKLREQAEREAREEQQRKQAEREAWEEQLERAAREKKLRQQRVETEPEVEEWEEDYTDQNKYKTTFKERSGGKSPGTAKPPRPSKSADGNKLLGITAGYTGKYDILNSAIYSDGGYQAGLTVRRIWYGFLGIKTGVYYGNYKFYPAPYGSYINEYYTESTIDIPLDAELIIPFSKSFSVFGYGGISAEIGLSSSRSNGGEYGKSLYWEYYDRNSFYLDYGGGIRIKHVQLTFDFRKALSYKRIQGDMEDREIQFGKATVALSYLIYF